MRATTYSLLAAFVSLAGVEQCYAAEANRPHYYYPRAINRPGEADQAEKRDAPANAKEARDNLLDLDEITIGLDGILGDSSEKSSKTPTPEVDPKGGILPPGGAAPTGDVPNQTPKEGEDGGLLDDVLPGLGDIFSDSPSPSSTTSSSSSKKEGLIGLLPGVDEPTPAPTPGKGSPSPESSSSSSSKKEGLIGLLPGVDEPTPAPTPGKDSPSPEPSSSSKGGLLPDLGLLPGDKSPTPATSSSSSSEPTPTPSREGLLPDLGELLPGDSTTSSEEGSPTGPSTSSKGGLIDLPDILPTGLFPSDDSSKDSPSAPETTKPGLIPDLPILPLPTDSSSSSEPPGLIPDLPSLIPSIPGLLPTDSSGKPSIPLPTPPGIFPSDPAHTGTGGLPVPLPTPTESPSSTSKSSSSVEKPTKKPKPSAKPSPKPTPTKRPPISTDSNTKMTVPTEIVFQPSASETTASSSSKPAPTNVPKLITPPNGMDEVPPGSTLIQLGFNPSLNYDFVAGLTTAVNQIFEFVPVGVGYGLGIKTADVAMKYLQPYEAENKDYRVTLAMMYIPKDLVDKLSVELFNPNSKLYTHPEVPVSTLMSAIDPSIPLIPGQGPGGLPQGGDDSGPGAGGEEKDGQAGGDRTGKSGGVHASAVGIGLGVVGGAALYGAAMFYVAKRYRQKRRSHNRASSVTGNYSDGSSSVPPSPSEGLMPGDGRDTRSSNGSGSNRSQMISAPVMSENSLGWN